MDTLFGMILNDFPMGHRPHLNLIKNCPQFEGNGTFDVGNGTKSAPIDAKDYDFGVQMFDHLALQDNTKSDEISGVNSSLYQAVSQVKAFAVINIELSN